MVGAPGQMGGLQFAPFGAAGDPFGGVEPFGGGRGKGQGGRGRNRGRGSWPGRGVQCGMFGGMPHMPAFPGITNMHPYAGMAGVPVMTEHGVQYLPYGFGGYGAAAAMGGMGGMGGGGYYMPPPYSTAAYGNTWPVEDHSFGGGYDSPAGGCADWPQQQDQDAS